VKKGAMRRVSTLAPSTNVCRRRPPTQGVVETDVTTAGDSLLATFRVLMMQHVLSHVRRYTRWTAARLWDPPANRAVSPRVYLDRSSDAYLYLQGWGFAAAGFSDHELANGTSREVWMLLKQLQGLYGLPELMTTYVIEDSFFRSRRRLDVDQNPPDEVFDAETQQMILKMDPDALSYLWDAHEYLVQMSRPVRVVDEVDDVPYLDEKGVLRNPDGTVMTATVEEILDAHQE